MEANFGSLRDFRSFYLRAGIISIFRGKEVELLHGQVKLAQYFQKSSTSPQFIEKIRALYVSSQ